MAKPIDHDFDSKVATAGIEVAKGSLLGIVGAGLLTAATLVFGVGMLGAVASFVGLGSFTGAAAAMMTGPGALITLASGIAGAFGFGGAGALIGGTYGLAKAGGKINRESQAYQDRVQGQMASVQNTAMMAMQQGYEMGMQDGQQKIVADLQQMHAQMLQKEMLGASAEKGKFAKGIEQQREAHAAAGPQLA
ncbi:MAG: hypothetical protein SFT92_00660 [Rickettsiales bacterium]|nr:hypothetical protein [Rickettsiales bacterium]